MNLNESMIYLAVTRGNCIWRVPLSPDGGVAKVGIYIQLSGGWGGPDGLALDSQGRLFIAHVGMGAVWVGDALGEPVYRIRAGAEPDTTNMAFGGAGKVCSQPPPSALNNVTRSSATLVVLCDSCCSFCNRLRSASSTVRKSATPSL